MSTFDLPNTIPAVPVRLTNELSEGQLLTFLAFKTWLSTLKCSLDLQRQDSHPLHLVPYTLRSITIQPCNFFGEGRLRFVKLRAEVSNDDGESFQGVFSFEVEVLLATGLAA
jgi:ADP-sugar diphosphatase